MNWNVIGFGADGARYGGSVWVPNLCIVGLRRKSIVVWVWEILRVRCDRNVIGASLVP